LSGWNDLGQRKHHRKHHKRPDVAERGMDEEVHGFVTEALPPLNIKVKSTDPFIPNGSDPSAFEGAAFSERKHHKKHHKQPDIAERGMDEEVHGFCVDSLPPLNTRERSSMPFLQNGSNGKAFKGSASFSEKKHHHHKQPDIAERGMDEEVHGFCVDSLPPLNTRERSNMPFLPNGSNGQAFKGSAMSERKHHHHKRPDVAERGMDEEVHGFVTEALPPLNIRVKSSDPFVPNGSDAKAFEGAAFMEGKPDISENNTSWGVHDFVYDHVTPLNTWERNPAGYANNGAAANAFEGAAFAEKKHHMKHHKRPDVAERGMDEEVHGFVTEALPPLNIKVKSTDPFVPNGSDPSAFEGAAFMQNKHHHHKQPDIAERGMDEEVHGFCVDSLPPLNTRERSNMPFLPNGSNGQAFKGSAMSERKHHHHKRPDVAERGMDEEVHGFVTEALPPLNIKVKSTDPFIPNGSDPSAFEGAAFMQNKHHHHKQPDIAERGMDEEVHGFCVDSLPPLNTRERSSMPFLPNGSNGKSFKGSASLMARSRKDIAERGMDEDVWGFATEAIPPLNVRSGEKEQMPWLMNGYKNQWAQVNTLAQ